MTIPILVTLDENYIPQLKVLLTSLYINHPGQRFDIYLLHSRIPDTKLSKLDAEMKNLGFGFFPIKASKEIFANARVTDRYPQEMYYRLLAAKFLPDTMDKILYLDPDILVINSLTELWNTDISDHLFAAASHTGITEAANSVNKIRLGTNSDYYNSGVLLINLKRCREEINPDDIFRFVAENPHELLLPDQDVLNALYGDRIRNVPDVLWNYDARNYSNYLLRSTGEADMEWVLRNTAVLHFCGRDKPWKSGYRRRFGSLYRHYMSLSERYLQYDQ